MPLGEPSPADVHVLLQALYESSPEAIGVSAAGVHRMVNPAYVALFGYSRAEDIVGRPIVELIAPVERERVAEMTRRRAAGLDVAGRYDTVGLRRDGSTFDMEVRVALHPLSGVPHNLVILRDLTERNVALAALRDSREFYRALFDVNSAVKLLIEAETGHIVDANAAALRFYGWSHAEICSMNVAEINIAGTGVVRAALQEARTGRVGEFEFRHRIASGEIRDVEVHTGPVFVRGGLHLLSIVHDVTDRKALHEQLMQSQRMEAVGRLAGTVAHDFNNLLTVMLGNADLALDQLPPGPARRHVEGMLSAAQRARDLTRKLLTFSRRQVRQSRRVSLNDAVGSAATFLRKAVGAKVRVEVELADGLPATVGDPGEIDQVVMNLSLNARDAMPDGGVLTLRTRRVVVPDGPVVAGRPRGGDYVALDVEDTGVGMNEATRAQIFEPYFTTKPRGQGTGLGLATVYGIVTQAGGHVLVDSAPGEGARFTVLLPVAPEGERASGAPAHGRVLVVTADEDARDLYTVVLRQGGLEVIGHEGGAEGMAAIRAPGARFDAVVADLALSSPSGAELAAAASERWPEVAIIMVTGDVRDESHLPVGDHVRVLRKPFSGAILLACVVEAMAPGVE